MYISDFIQYNSPHYVCIPTYVRITNMLSILSFAYDIHIDFNDNYISIKIGFLEGNHLLILYLIVSI